MSKALDALTGAVERQNALLGQIAQQTKPPTPEPRIGRRSHELLTDGDYMVRHVPVLQIAFKRKVPDKHVE
jgi:hypothetical protein